MGKWKTILRSSSGFTLIELAIAVFIISVLIAVSLPGLRGTGEKAQHTTCEGNQRLLRAQLENYYLTEKGYPAGATDAERLQKLVDQRYVQTLPSCPSGGSYKITISADQTGAALECTHHGALGL